jgi:polar amino acid transport system substrate-binding protein
MISLIWWRDFLGRHARASASMAPLLVCCAILATPAAARADALAEIQRRGVLVWGADAEGGGPYVYPDPADPRKSSTATS